MSDHVKLGYLINDDEHSAVDIPIRHMVVAGQTQEAGKTTTLEALIQRSGKTAIAFVTKRGEGSFSTGGRIRPYFRERADWQFVSSILEATMREKLKFERSWIINASKGAKTLADVHKNVKKALLTARGISEGVYTTLDAYLDIVVPRIAEIDFDRGHLNLSPGLNVVDLSDRNTFPTELQALVMRSVIEWVYLECEETITVIPEAWEFLPQGRGSPVKLAATELIRKGAGLRNYVWLDSQDIGGIDKEILRSCPVWLLGVQREMNEIKRTLGNIPETTAKPKPAAIATLERGQFYACFGKHSHKTYVQPAWVTDAAAKRIAAGELDPSFATASKPTRNLPPEGATPRPRSLAVPVRPYEQPSKESEDDLMSTEAVEKLDRIIELLEARAGTSSPAARGKADPPSAAAPIGSLDEEAIYQRFKERLKKDAPALLKLMSNVPEIEVREQRVTVQADISQAKGMIAKLMSEGFFDDAVLSNAVWNELKRRWNYKGISARAYEQCEWFASTGFMTKEADGYRAVTGMKVNVVQS